MIVDRGNNVIASVFFFFVFVGGSGRDGGWLCPSVSGLLKVKAASTELKGRQTETLISLISQRIA